MVCVGMSADFNLFHQIPSISSLTAGSPRAPPALAAQLRAFSVISSSLRAELSTSRNHSVGKVSAFADVCSNRSHPLTVCQRYCGRRRLLRHRPRPQCLFGRGSFIHASQALRPEKRGSPLPMGRTGTDFITLPLHCVRTRPAGKEVRLRLVLFDARLILSGSVVHFVSDTSSEGERRRETVRDGVQSSGTPSLTVSQSGIAPLELRSLLCRAYTLQGLQFLRCGCGIYADCAETILVSSPFTAPIPPPTLRRSSPIPPARLTRPKVVAAVPSFDCQCQSRKDRHLSPRPSYRPAPAAPVGLPAHSPEDRKNDASASPFPTSYESSCGMNLTLQAQCIIEPHHTPGAMIMNIFT